MASKKISELTEFADLEVFPDGAYIPLVSEGVTYKLKLENLLSKTLRTDKPSEISSVTSKSVISNNDLIMLEDSSDSNKKKLVQRHSFFMMFPRLARAVQTRQQLLQRKDLFTLILPQVIFLLLPIPQQQLTGKQSTLLHKN